MKLLTTDWVKEKDCSLLILEQCFSSGEYQISLNEDINLTFSSDYSENDKLSYNPLNKTFFKTSFGIIALSNAESFFEMLSNIVYSKEYPLAIEKWFRVCVLNGPDKFSDFWGEIIPCEIKDMGKPFPIKMNMLQEKSGVSSTIWASSDTCKKIISSKLLNYVENKENFPRSNRSEYKIDLNLFQTIISKKNIESLDCGDILLAENLLIDEDGFGEVNIFDKNILVKLIKKNEQFFIEIIDVNQHSNNQNLNVRYAGDFANS